MTFRGTNPESYITEYTLGYEGKTWSWRLSREEARRRASFAQHTCRQGFISISAIGKTYQCY